MGYWDSLCPLCGVAADGGPCALACEWSLLRHINEFLIEELHHLGIRGSGDDLEESDDEEGSQDADLLQILEDGFQTGVSRNCQRRALPWGYGMGYYCRTYVGIGYWSEDGEFDAWRHHPEDDTLKLAPDGREVGTLRLRNADGYGGSFGTVVTQGDNGGEREIQRHINCHPVDSPCLFLCEHCYHYLSAWLDWDVLPDRSCGFPDDPQPLSLAGELYEIVYSRRQKRSWFHNFCISTSI